MDSCIRRRGARSQKLDIGGPGRARAATSSSLSDRIELCRLPYNRPAPLSTGDLGRINEAGEVDIVGAWTAQVKVAVIRVELAEDRGRIAEQPHVIGSVAHLS